VPIISNFKGIELIILGGLYDKKTEINTGEQACSEVNNFVADLYFMAHARYIKILVSQLYFKQMASLNKGCLKIQSKHLPL